jgi:hypothetical protein
MQKILAVLMFALASFPLMGQDIDTLKRNDDAIMALLMKRKDAPTKEQTFHLASYRRAMASRSRATQIEKPLARGHGQASSDGVVVLRLPTAGQ